MAKKQILKEEHLNATLLNSSEISTKNNKVQKKALLLKTFEYNAHN